MEEKEHTRLKQFVFRVKKCKEKALILTWIISFDRLHNNYENLGSRKNVNLNVFYNYSFFNSYI